jgi:hypothetical protein
MLLLGRSLREIGSTFLTGKALLFFKSRLICRTNDDASSCPEDWLFRLPGYKLVPCIILGNSNCFRGKMLGQKRNSEFLFGQINVLFSLSSFQLNSLNFSRFSSADPLSISPLEQILRLSSQSDHSNERNGGAFICLLDLLLIALGKTAL